MLYGNRNRKVINMTVYERCNTCKHKDKEKSNEQWLVCSKIPLEVVLAGTSENCKAYVEEDGTVKQLSFIDD